VLETALKVIDRDGSGQFSMRRVADELGIGVMTLYGYVRNKEEMVEGVAGLVFAEIEPEVPRDASWEDRLRVDAMRLHAFCRRHPHVVTLVLAQSSASPGLFHIRERMLATLLSAGFDEATALHALGALTSYAVGFGSMQGRFPAIDLPERIRELPADDFPHLAAAADRYADHLSDEAFEYGLDLLLDGLRAQAG
jgi:AcrR family transcriptional regulator